MAQKDATVGWSLALGVYVNPDTILVDQGTGATVIQWTHDGTIASFQITGLDASVFRPASSPAQAQNFSTTDANNVVGDFNYTVTVTHLDGSTVEFDPKIQNGGNV